MTENLFSYTHPTPGGLHPWDHKESDTAEQLGTHTPLQPNRGETQPLLQVQGPGEALLFHPLLSQQRRQSGAAPSPACTEHGRQARA